MPQELHELRENVTRAVGIVRNLLVFTETNSLNRRWHNLNELVSAAVDSRRTELAAAGVRVSLEGAARLPLVYVDGRQLESVIATLLDRWTKGGRPGAATTVVVSTQRRTSDERLIVRHRRSLTSLDEDDATWSGDLGCLPSRARNARRSARGRTAAGRRVWLPSGIACYRRRCRGECCDMNNVIDFINVNRDRYLDELKALLAIPSISALPEHAADVKRCAEWCADEMRRIGMQNVHLIPTPGNPVVYGDWLGAAGAPTILFYGHYDVQPVDPLNLWETPPFEATIRDGEIYARGSADDKGQVFMHFKAIEAHLKQNSKLPVNITHHPRRRRRSRQRQPRQLHHRQQRHAQSRRRRHLGLADVCEGRFRRSATGSAVSSTRKSTCAAAAPTCIPDRLAAPSRIPRSCSRR